ncbi:MAG: SCP2 sterol-binding domain-containing protein [Caldilineaceae bacterium]|nr:SCP2 sterol-binding domain-containing protein [Caldilineaceae bacterium]
MNIFQSDEHLYEVLQLVFDQVNATPGQIEPFTRSNLVIRIRTAAPEAEILLDGRQPPLEVFYGPRPGKANLEIALPANLLHAIWLGEEKGSNAFFSGKVKTKGNLMKAMPLLDLFRECERVYPQIAVAKKLV